MERSITEHVEVPPLSGTGLLAQFADWSAHQPCHPITWFRHSRQVSSLPTRELGRNTIAPE